MTIILLLWFSAARAEMNNNDWHRLRTEIETLDCRDLSAWQRQLDFFSAGQYLHLLVDPAKSRCFAKWTPAQRACFSNMQSWMDGRDAFFGAGPMQTKVLGEERFKDLTDLSDLFPCAPPPENPSLRICRPTPGWPERFLNCIRSKSTAGECKKVEGWCAVRMNRHHEGLMDTKDHIVFYDPKKLRFIINFESPGTPRDAVIDMFQVVKPAKESEPWMGVYSTFYGGLQMAPNNHSAGTGCWHCHPAGAPRKLEPLWGSVSGQDRAGVECINGAISKMGDFSANHLWPGAKFGPARGEGAATAQACNDCHSGDISQNYSYPQRGLLFHNAQMTREMLTKMTSWSPSMPPGLAAKVKDFDKYRAILDRVYDLPDESREKVLERYVGSYRERAGAKDRNEFPDRDLARSRDLLEARRLAQADALRLMMTLPAGKKKRITQKDIDLVTRVSKEIDGQGLKAFGEITARDRERLALWMRGGRDQCLTSPTTGDAEAPATTR